MWSVRDEAVCLSRFSGCCVLHVPLIFMFIVFSTSGMQSWLSMYLPNQVRTVIRGCVCGACVSGYNSLRLDKPQGHFFSVILARSQDGGWESHWFSILTYRQKCCMSIYSLVSRK